MLYLSEPYRWVREYYTDNVQIIDFSSQKPPCNSIKPNQTTYKQFSSKLIVWALDQSPKKD